MWCEECGEVKGEVKKYDYVHLCQKCLDLLCNFVDEHNSRIPRMVEIRK